jgi:hypothetical protein
VNPSRLQRAATFIWGSARLLDRHLFAHLFEGGPREAVVAALRPYQNADGGFGNALEPDIRTPTSQPVAVEMALRTLDLVGGDTELELRACDYLQSIAAPAGGVPFSLPSLNPHPHAPWWTAPDDPPAALNPTAALVGLLRKHGVRHPWVDRAEQFCWHAIATSETREFHDLVPMITFLEHAPDRARAEGELARLAARIAEPGVVELRTNAEGYVHGPLDWAPLATSFCRSLFADAVLAEHLAALAARQQPDGGWGISWPPVSAGAEAEWRGAVTIGALRTLASYKAAGLAILSTED